MKTSTFVRGALELSQPVAPPAVRDAYLAPYRTPERRAAIGALRRRHPARERSIPAMTLSRRLPPVSTICGDVPALLLWGSSDPVFSDIYLHDLEARLPHADVHRFSDARHYVPEDADIAGAVHTWVSQLDVEPSAHQSRRRAERLPLWAGLERRAGDDDVAVIEMTACRSRIVR